MNKRFEIEKLKLMNTLISSTIKLDKDYQDIPVDITKFRCMTRSLLYLIESRPDIMFSVCLCAISAVKFIFRYLSGTTTLGLWYPNGTQIDSLSYLDVDWASYKIEGALAEHVTFYDLHLCHGLVRNKIALYYLQLKPNISQMLAVVLKFYGRNKHLVIITYRSIICLSCVITQMP